MTIVRKKMYAILTSEESNINSPLNLGGGLVLFKSMEMALLWKKLHTTVDKKDLYSVYEVIVEFSPYSSKNKNQELSNE